MDGSTITSLVEAVTKKWAKQRKAEEREANARTRRYEVMTRSRRETMKDVAWEIMEKAYLKASSNATLPAHARQIMYAARGEIQERTGRQLDDQYFTQTLLPNYMAENPEETESWDVVFDARGHFAEPHTKRITPLGTIDVRDYLEKTRSEDSAESEFELPKMNEFPTCGPENRFGAVLFVEKEGFLPLFQKVRLAERYDLAIMSTKGMSVTAGRLLIDQVCAHGDGVPLLVLHDFDKSGFSILGTLQRDTRRYEFENQFEVIDLGLRLEDVKAQRLESETVSYGRSDPTWNLQENGASKEEIAFLCERSSYEGYHGKRVELNAFNSADLVQWIESKLKKHGVRKVIPDEEVLENAYRRALQIKLLNDQLEDLHEHAAKRASEAKVLRGLRRRIESSLKANPEKSWDEVVAEEVASEDFDE